MSGREIWPPREKLGRVYVLSRVLQEISTTLRNRNNVVSLGDAAIAASAPWRTASAWTLKRLATN